MPIMQIHFVGRHIQKQYINKLIIFNELSLFGVLELIIHNQLVRICYLC